MKGSKETPLGPLHRRLGARMVDFAGFSMPLQYSSILREHAAVREAAGLFDVSHMGQIALRGERAAAAAGRLLSRPVEDLGTGCVRYALLCNDAGGVVDDVTVYRRDAQDVMLCVNAANIDKDLAWIRGNADPDVEIRDESRDTALLALQGPASARLLDEAGAPEAAGLGRFRFATSSLAGHPVLISRTGYTGDDGFEIYCASADAEALFEMLLAGGEGSGLLPAGLGARDTLRLEAALPLYGHELDDTTSPLEAGLDRFVRPLERDFIGAAAIRQRRDAGHARRLVGFALEGRGVAREGYPVVAEGERVGVVTSGAPSPTLGKSIGLAYVSAGLSEPGRGFEILVRGRAHPARVTPTPFVGGKARAK